MKTETIAAIATGMSNSGIGIVRISGDQAFEVIDRIYRNKKGQAGTLWDAKSHTAHYGYIYDGDERIDEVLVLIMRGPNSYTAEDTVEIDCHGAGKYMTGFKTVSAMVKAMVEELNITVPVALHLDHGSYEGSLKCIEAGFSSIMFDGSHYPIAENVEKTTELVKLCGEKGISLEAEVGSIGGEEDGVVGLGECADPNECKAVADLGIDMLAAGIGNIHGKYPANWPGLRFDVLESIKEKVGDMPLVLHGGTGIPAEMIQKAISLGVAKINVNTECQLSFAEATRKYIEAGKDLEGKGFDPRKLLAPGTEAIKATVKEKMELFGSVGKA